MLPFAVVFAWRCWDGGGGRRGGVVGGTRVHPGDGSRPGGPGIVVAMPAVAVPSLAMLSVQKFT
jgi:hypothetical protein